MPPKGPPCDGPKDTHRHQSGRDPGIDFPLVFRPLEWADLEGLNLLIYLCIFVRSVPKTQSAHEWDLELVSGSDLWCNLHYFSSRCRSRGSPKGPKIGRTPGAGFIILSSLRSAQLDPWTPAGLVLVYILGARIAGCKCENDFLGGRPPDGWCGVWGGEAVLTAWSGL